MTSIDSTTSQDNPQDEPQTISIPLTKGHTAIIDAVDSDLAKLKWHSFPAYHTNYASRHASGSRKSELLHRVILSRMLECELTKDDRVDHVNGDGLDNRRCNLRLANRNQNAQNQRRNSRNSSGLKGVTFNKANQKWVSQITVNKKVTYLGSFDTPEAAHEAYCEAARKHFGEFARFE